MLGNVWEWCEDWHDDYRKDFARDPRGPGRGVFRVLRGGSWSHHARFVRAAERGGYSPDIRDALFGVRLAQGQGEPGAEPQSSPSPPARFQSSAPPGTIRA